jgi:hypothetical protein
MYLVHRTHIQSTVLTAHNNACLTQVPGKRFHALLDILGRANL